MATLAHFVLSLAAALALTGHPATTSNRLAAARDAERLLSNVVLPPDAQRLTDPPPGVHRTPFQVPTGAQRVDRYRFWRVSEPLGAVMRFARTHRPRGAQRSGSGYESGGTVFFAYPAQAGRTSGRWLAVTMVELPDGSTGVKADAQEIWIVPRPATEAVPAGIREIEIRSPHRLLRVTDRAKVTRIIRWFDRLPTVQPGIFNCPMLIEGPKIRLVFRGARGILARASFAADSAGHSLVSTRCTPISLSVRGQRETPLVGGRFLLRVQHLVAAKLR